MQRTQIYLDPIQMKSLKKIASKREISISEVIREAIWGFISQQQKPSRDSLDGIIGLYEDQEDSQGSLHHDDIYE